MFAFVSMIVLRKVKYKRKYYNRYFVFSIIAWVTGLGKFNGVVGSDSTNDAFDDF